MTIKDSRNILIPVLILIGIGTVMIYSSTALMSIRKYGSAFHYLLKHLFTVAIGCVAMFLLSRINYQRLRPFVYILLGLSIVLLVLVFVPGIGISANGARRWLKLWPTTFQPSELVKVVMVFFLADYMDKNFQRMKEFKHGILVPVGVMILFQIVIIMQPDFGAVMSIGIITFCLLILGGARLTHIGMLVLCSLPAIYILVTSSAYRMKRVMCFTDPWKDPYGCGFQLIQSFIAFGSGNIFGIGLGGSRQKLYYLPEGHTDFIFSLIGEELGFLGAAIVLAVFIWLIIRGLQVSSRAGDMFSYFLSIGLTLMIGVQAIINFAVATGLMPTKGLPLPFISYGGSSLLINMAAVGILISISMRNRQDGRDNLSTEIPMRSRTVHHRRRR